MRERLKRFWARCTEPRLVPPPTDMDRVAEASTHCPPGVAAQELGIPWGDAEDREFHERHVRCEGCGMWLNRAKGRDWGGGDLCAYCKLW